MRLLYVVVGVFVGMVFTTRHIQKHIDIYGAAWNQYLVKAQVMAYYEGHTKGMSDSEIRMYDNYGSCFEELDELRAIIRQEKKK